MEILQEDFCRLITLDIQLPGMSGLEFARQLRSAPDGDAYYILVGTGNSRPEDLKAILDAGADDYIAKPYHPGLLNIRLSVAESALVGIARRKALEAELVFMARHDPLTKLLNRSTLTDAVEQAIRRAKEGFPGAVLYIDLDNFKIVNDSLGHETGDDLLLKVAATLRRVSRREDNLIRFGGDEFVLVMPGCPVEVAVARANSLREAVEELVYVARGRTLRVGMSIGIAPVLGHERPGEVMASADEACYAAKARGKNCVEVHTPETTEIARLITDTDWSSRIRDAMANNTLQLWYQPMVTAGTGRCFAQELLLRFEESEGQMIAPPIFLESLRRSRQMSRLDRFVIARAFDALARHAGLTVSINISGQLFSDIEYAEFVESMIKNSGIAPERVLFEITEEDLITNLKNASGAIRQLKAVGCRFGLDDFGTGFSSLSYLRELPIDFIKIDGQFVRQLDRNPFHQAVIKAIQGIADVLGIQTVAEFVETAEECALLASLGVNHFQGYFFSEPRKKPISEDEIAGFASLVPPLPKAGGHLDTGANYRV
ncbi:MAG: hypothetical protein Fur0032_20340 [Terrimicrobiaceae bacterium]